jgi:hypothetical protein
VNARACAIANKQTNNVKTSSLWCVKKLRHKFFSNFVRFACEEPPLFKHAHSIIDLHLLERKSFLSHIAQLSQQNDDFCCCLAEWTHLEPTSTENVLLWVEASGWIDFLWCTFRILSKSGKNQQNLDSHWEELKNEEKVKSDVSKHAFASRFTVLHLSTSVFLPLVVPFFFFFYSFLSKWNALSFLLYCIGGLEFSEWVCEECALVNRKIEPLLSPAVSTSPQTRFGGRSSMGRRQSPTLY